MTSNTSLLNKAPEGLLNTLDDKSPLPLYHRLYVLLREQIISGSYRNGESLPPENDLVQNFGVSRITVRKLPIVKIPPSWGVRSLPVLMA